MRYSDLPEGLHDAWRVAWRSGLVTVQMTGWPAQALEQDAYLQSLNPAFWLSPLGKDALAMHRVQAAPPGGGEAPADPRKG
jgi:hypothetical protein